MGYHYFWWAFSSGNPVEAANNIFFSPYSLKFLFYVIFQAAGVYFNLYYLIPRFLEKGQYVVYMVGLVATIICTSALILIGYYGSAYLSSQTFLELYKVAPDQYFHFFKTNTFPSTIAAMTLAMSIKLTKNWLEARQHQQLLEKEKLETELKFLKSQFNPHFLFNTINSIFVLIHKNPKMASESLAKFSDLLRYQLYECNEAQIPLSHELAYLNNFIELEKLRQENDLRLDIDIMSPKSGQLTIAPFILMPFIENAFKYAAHSKRGDNWISVRLAFSGHELQYEVANSTPAEQHQTKEVLTYGGIGLKNVQRRLDLIYPNAHELTIQQKEQEFSIRLALQLRADVKSNTAVLTNNHVY